MDDPSGRIDRLSPVKRALLEQRALRAQLESMERARTEPIAIIGVGCRFPGGADGPEALWRLLCDGFDAVSEVPSDRWDVDAYYDANADAPAKVSTRWGGFLDRIGEFDPHFFGISPREAMSMDPQQRLLLEVAWEALEHAAQPLDKLPGTPTGVFVGIGTSDYLLLQTKSDSLAAIDTYSATGSSHSVASGRLSYVLGLQGPSISVDTACSASLVTVHLACQSLRAGECRMALAGGVSVILAVDNTISLSKARLMARDGRCKTFDAAADGFVRSDGCGMVVLKRLSDALADRDQIIALIRGWAVNQDGRSNGLTAPNGPSQEDVIRMALRGAGIEPGEVQYIECHGTGTQLGDPIEVGALQAVFGPGRPKDAPLRIGSLKTNVGHMEAAAGVGGLIKAALCLQHEQIPPHLHFRKPNPHIAWEGCPFDVPTESVPWPRGNGRRIAGVSSFGFSGTNAHLVLEEAPARSADELPSERPLHLFTLSAKDDATLNELAARHERYLATHETLSVADVCFTVNAGRAHFEARLAVAAKSTGELRQRLGNVTGEKPSEGVFRGRTESGAPRVAFLCTGQGSQYVGMGRQLYETQPTFRQALDRCAELLRPHIDRPLLTVLYPLEGTSSPIDETAYTQPALFALEYALAALWRSWGVEPAAILGHSVGECVAACLAGVISLEDGLRLVAARGRMMQALPADGVMAAVFADEAQVREALMPYRDRVAIAAINTPTGVVVSGSGDAVRAVCEGLSAQGIKSAPLRVSHAFHSPLMEPMLPEFERFASGLTFMAPRIPLVENVTGEFFGTGVVPDARYWRRHAREAVRFAAGMATLRRAGCTCFLEIGPAPTLVEMGRQCLAGDAGLWLPSLRRGVADWTQMLESVANLYVTGADIDWEGFDRDYTWRRVALPTYPFRRQRYWFQPTATTRTKSTDETSYRWNTLIERARHQASQIPVDLDLGSYTAKWKLLDRFTTAQIARALRQLGAYGDANEGHTVDDVLTTCGILPGYRNLVRRWLKKLALEGLLSRRGDSFVCDVPLRDDLADELRGPLETALRDVVPLWEYLERCGRKLCGVLTGAESPLETLFPSGSFVTADYLYRDWPMVRYYNGIIRSLIECVGSAGASRSPLRVLEIGAGTGGTTSALLPVLRASETTYWFTDLSDLFLSRARQRFSAYPFVRYGRLDMDRDPQGQGLPTHCFDVVIAANILHATRDVGASLDRVRSLLAPDGLLVMYEVTEHFAWFEMSVGLIEGWQAHQDDVRDEDPLLAPEQWREILARHGFEAVAVFPEADSPTTVLGHHVIVARAPGVEGMACGGVEAELAKFELDNNADADSEEGSEEASAIREPGSFVAGVMAAHPDEREQLLVSLVCQRVMEILRLDRLHVPAPSDRLMHIGVDSLMALELKSRLGKDLEIGDVLPATLVFDYPTIEAVARYLLQRILGPNGGSAERGGTRVGLEPGENDDASTAARRAGELAAMSETEAEQQLLEKLKNL